MGGTPRPAQGLSSRAVGGNIRFRFAQVSDRVAAESWPAETGRRSDVTPDEARGRLVAELAGSGAFDDGWREAFERVPRHLFIPDTVWRLNGSGRRLVPLCHRVDPGRWLALAYADAPLDTQVDDGHPGAGGGVEVTSSASRPSAVAGMLGALALGPGMRVLEIGTGTGWKAALLANRVGAGNVVTIEVDPDVADWFSNRFVAMCRVSATDSEAGR